MDNKDLEGLKALFSQDQSKFLPKRCWCLPELERLGKKACEVIPPLVEELQQVSVELKSSKEEVERLLSLLAAMRSYASSDKGSCSGSAGDR